MSRSLLCVVYWVANVSISLRLNQFWLASWRCTGSLTHREPKLEATSVSLKPPRRSPTSRPQTYRALASNPGLTLLSQRMTLPLAPTLASTSAQAGTKPHTPGWHRSIRTMVMIAQWDPLRKDSSRKLRGGSIFLRKCQNTKEMQRAILMFKTLKNDYEKEINNLLCCKTQWVK